MPQTVTVKGIADPLVFPDSMPPEQIQQAVANFVKSGTYLKAVQPQDYDSRSEPWQRRYGPTAGMSGGQLALAGAGKAYYDVGRGAGQMVGLESRADVAESRALDAPLMRTTPAKLGNIGGNVALTLPALAIPGASTVPGAALVGAGLGLLQPSVSTRETLLNTGLGAASGALGQYAGNKVAAGTQSRLANRAQTAADQESLNSARDAVLAESKAAGYRLPPTAVNPNLTNTALESVSGKAATRQAAEAMNAKVSNRLIAEDLGLAANRPITEDALKAIRGKAGAVYGIVKKTGAIAADQQYLDEIAKLGSAGADLEGAFPGIGAQAGEKVQKLVTSLAQPQFDAEQAVTAFRFLNDRAKQGFKAAFAKGGDQDLLELARAQKGAADAMGELIERHLTSSTNPYAVSFGNQALAKSWQEARTTIAKSYVAEAALKGGHIDAIQLAAQLRKGAPLSGGFKTVAQFGDMFGEAARVPKSGVGVSKLAALFSGGGAVTALATGHPEVAAVAAAGAAAPWAVRKSILSQAGQSLLASPSYAPNLLGTGALNAIGKLGRYGTLPAFSAGAPLVRPEQQY